jgi:hypothetical protein
MAHVTFLFRAGQAARNPAKIVSADHSMASTTLLLLG